VSLSVRLSVLTALFESKPRGFRFGFRLRLGPGKYGPNLDTPPPLTDSKVPVFKLDSMGELWWSKRVFSPSQR